MHPYVGTILIGNIKNRQTVSVGMDGSSIHFHPMSEKNVRFVHYPDCQQLIIWLTHPGGEYGNVRLKNITDKSIAEEWPVMEKLSGSVQLLWDTLFIAPGSYCIEIDYKNGWQHLIEIEKLEKGIVSTVEPIVPAPGGNEKISESPSKYRDGFGKIIENDDMVLRERVNRDLARKLSRHIEYKGNFRSGTIIYVDNEVRIEFYHEMGGGNCMFYIDIPTEDQWEAATRTLLSERQDILEFVAARVKSEQASTSHYIIQRASIVFYN